MSGWAAGEPVQTPGVNDVYEYNEVHLASSQRDAGDNDHPVWNLHPDLHNVLGVKVLAAQIPHSYFTVVDSGPARNNFLRYEAGGLQYPPLEIAPGQYDANGLADAIRTASGGKVSFTFASTLGTYGFMYVPANTPGVLHFEEGHLCDILGWPRQAVPFAATPANTYALRAPGVAQLSGPNCLYLVSNAISGRISRNVRCNGNSTPNPPLVASIPVDVNFGQVICYRDPNPAPCFDMGMDQLTTLDLQLLDCYTLLPVQLNGAPWTVVLQVLTQRDTSVARTQQNDRTGNKRIRVR